MMSLTSALGFSTSDKAQFRFHVLQLLYSSGFKTVHQAFPNLSRPTIYRWKKTYESSYKKLRSLVPKSTRPKNTRRMQTSLPILTLIKSLREKYPRMGKAKIKLFVDAFCFSRGEKTLQVSTIGKIIKRNNFFFVSRERRRKRKLESKNRVRGCPKVKNILPGYLQVDGVKFWYLDKYYYFLTAIEITTRQAFVKLVSNLSSKQAAIFLEHVGRECRVPIHTVQTDNGSEFEKHFEEAIKALSLTHLWSYPHSPKTNGYVERFNWTIQDEFLFIHEDLLLYLDDFEKKLSDWVVYYNQVRPHQGLNYLTPFQYQEQQGICLKSV